MSVCSIGSCGSVILSYTVHLELFPFCYRCTFLKRCDRLCSAPFYYRSPICSITVLRSVLLPFSDLFYYRSPICSITVLRSVLLPFSDLFYYRSPICSITVLRSVLLPFSDLFYYRSPICSITVLRSFYYCSPFRFFAACV